MNGGWLAGKFPAAKWGGRREDKSDRRTVIPVMYMGRIHGAEAELPLWGDGWISSGGKMSDSGGRFLRIDLTDGGGGRRLGGS